MGALEKEVQRVGDVALVGIDPVALIATKDSHKNAETRRDLQPLADLVVRLARRCSAFTISQKEQPGATRKSD